MQRRQRGSFAWCSTAILILLPMASAHAQPPEERAGERVTTLDHAVEFYISNDALQALYVRTLDLGDVGPTEVRGGFFYNEDRDLIAVGDLLALVGDAIEERPLELRVGARVYGAFLAPEDQDVFGIGLGGEAEYFFNSARSVSVKLSAFYSPDIATFGVADNVTDASLRLLARMRDGTDVFVGFRMFEIDLPVDREVDDNLHVGFRRSF